jgi:hypothetical protein
MRTTLAVLSLAVGLGFIACQSAAALPISAGAIQQAATAASSLERAQYAEHTGRHYITKCYRDFFIGRYTCHRYWYR